MDKIKKVIATIKKYKDRLIKIARERGIYENFGQKEVRDLKSKFINSSEYSNEMNKIRKLIDGFDEWVLNYNGEWLKWKLVKY